MFRDTEDIIVTLPLDLAAILLIGIAMIAFHDTSANQAFLFAVSVVPLSRVWTMVYERRWGDEQPAQEEHGSRNRGLLQKTMSYVGFELVLFFAFTSCSIWILNIDTINAILTGIVLVPAHTTYWAMAKSITEER
ncbi:hypothetical protein QQF73_17215 [Marinobacter sp. M216]|uniref:PACE efflux transporter n=1 Tax=Marinobacter albus TaxID=3030833 RepID=A0ABT7HG70_9GAMM|nr:MULTISPECIES: hypothetical protein [unclassified Marinobacter]MBW7472825.1 hypothetical protein [Marinobacter sp. F4218]MDK9559378.1 hypothetical protein [Marinobacter sp. M216]